ncbi:MAG TPA: hypothetical protein EYM77_11310 [Dehalococcoidia bacterium]|nr:hypothetical protein [Dehalococcoidia bacterium]
MRQIYTLHQESKHITTLMVSALKGVPLPLNAYKAETAGISTYPDKLESKQGFLVLDEKFFSVK